MSESDLEDYLVLRELPEPIEEDDLKEAGKRSEDTLEELRSEGVGIEWVESEVMKRDGKVAGTFCHYRAEDEAAIREHAERASLPATRIDRRGEPLDGE
jgi:hypothetical protein